MADGLFGFKSPTELQNQYYSGLMVSPAQIGQQGLLQQLVSTAANAGAMMGYGGGRLLGGKVAGEADAEVIQQALADTRAETDPTKRLRSMADILTTKGMDDAAFKLSAQADKFEEASLSKQEREARMAETKRKADKDAAEETKRVKLVDSRKKSLREKFPNMNEADVESIASDEATFRTYIKPPKDSTPSEFGRMLLEAGYDADSDEYKKKMSDYTAAKLKAAGGDTAAVESLKVQQKLLDIELTKQKVAGEKAKAADKEYKNRLSFLSGQYQTKRMSGFVKQAKDLVNEWSTGWGAALFDRLPASDARKLRTSVDTIKANIGFDKLTQMRAASPTGGALGQVSERELGFLQSVLTNLDTLTDPEQMRENLDAIDRHYKMFLNLEKAGQHAAKNGWSDEQSTRFVDALESGKSYSEALAIGDGRVESSAGTPAPSAGTPAPSAGGAKPKPTKRFNPETGKLEDV